MSSVQDFYFPDPAAADRSLRFSVPLDGTRISLGPFPFRPRSIVLVNQTTQNLIVEDDRGEQYIAAQSIGATYGMGDSVRLQAYLDKPPVPVQGKATVVVSEQPAGISAAQLSSFAAISGADTMIVGRVLGNGTVAFGAGFTVNRLSAGRYQINFNTVQPSIPVVLAAVAEAFTGNEDVTLAAVGAAHFQVNVNDAGAAVDREFNFLSKVPS